MKLTLKLASSLLAVCCLVWVVNVYIGVRLQGGAADAATIRDTRAMAAVLAASAAALWESHGKDRALELIEAANEEHREIEVRWVDPWSGRRDDQPLAEISVEDLAAGGSVFQIMTDSKGHRTLYSYALIARGPRRYGVIELEESLVNEDELVSVLSVTTAFTGAAMAFISALLAVFLGRRWIAVPIRALIELTRRVARGDFSVQAAVHGTAEIAELSRAMNGMSQELERVMSQLRHADRLNTIGRLASGLAHELGTPLHVAMGRAKAVFTDTRNPPQAREHAEVVIRQTERMSYIIRQLLTFAHAKDLHRRITNIRNVLIEAVAMVQPLADRRHIEIRLPDSASLPLIACDPTQFQQVITNLLLNAVHASEDQGVVTIGVREEIGVAERDGDGGLADYVICSVEDAGPGIAPDVLPHVFEPFFTTREVGEGTGLGLSVALGIIREHGGWIDVDTRLGAGTSFSVVLPAPS